MSVACLAAYTVGMPGRAEEPENDEAEPRPSDGDSDFDHDGEDGPAWAQGAGVRWFGVVVFLALGAFAVLVLIATLLAIYDRARDDSPPPGAAEMGTNFEPDAYSSPIDSNRKSSALSVCLYSATRSRTSRARLSL